MLLKMNSTCMLLCNMNLNWMSTSITLSEVSTCQNEQCTYPVQCGEQYLHFMLLNFHFVNLWQWLAFPCKNQIKSINFACTIQINIITASWEIIIDWFLGDALGVLFCQFWSTVLECGVRLQIHTMQVYRMWQWGLHAVFRSHIGTRMCLLSTEPRSTTVLLYPC